MYHTRKYSVCETFFSDIDSEDKAYILGFIFADGCVSDYSIAFNLSKRDEAILSKIRNCLGSNAPIAYPLNSKVGVFRNKIIKSGLGARLDICSRVMSLDLQKLGCVKRKSLVLKFPNIPSQVMRHFIRGYFDGDGFVCVDKFNCLRAGFTSTYEFCIGLKDALLRFGVLSGKIRTNHSVYTLAVGKKANLLRFAETMYDGATIFLDRKLNIFHNYFKW
jgi:hypothetical protein